MSAILLSNPFVVPPPAPAAPQTYPAGFAPPAIGATGGASGTKDNTSFTNTGAGAETAKQAETVALFQKRQGMDRPANATGSSVINAQTQTVVPGKEAASEDELKLGPDLPEVEMPNPLPTAPFLLDQNDVRALEPVEPVPNTPPQDPQDADLELVSR